MVFKLPKFSVVEWNWEINELIKSDGPLTLESGIDSFEVLKDEKITELDRYIVKVKKNTKIFNLETICEFKYSKNEKKNEDRRYDQMRNIVSLECGFLLSIFLKYNDFPPFPLLLEFKGNANESTENSRKN